jgi:hypothetical protein
MIMNRGDGRWCHWGLWIRIRVIASLVVCESGHGFVGQVSRHGTRLGEDEELQKLIVFDGDMLLSWEDLK